MLNDRTSALSLLKSRRSGRPREMVGPGPSDEELRQILEVAMRVPDHGKLVPWRFVIVGKDQREQFAVLLRRALQEEDECAGPAHHEKADQFARQGEALIVLHTPPGEANRVGAALDRSAWPEVTGTIAGDDTIFLAVRDAAAQRRVLRELRRLVKPA